MKYISIIFIVVVIGGSLIMWFRSSKHNSNLPTKLAATPFDMLIDDSFRLKIDGSAVVVGMINTGEIRPGLEFEVRMPGSAIPVTVISLEGGPNKPISNARAGDRIAVMIKGVNKDQIASAARLSSRNR